MNRIRKAWRWLDRKLRIGSYKIRPVIKVINRKLDPHYLHRKGKK